MRALANRFDKPAGQSSGSTSSGFAELYPYLEYSNLGTFLEIYVQPGTRVTRLAGIHDNRLKIQLSSPPVDGKANLQLIAFFSSLFQIAKKDIHIIKGEHSRFKRVQIKRINTDIINCINSHLKS